MQLYSVAQVAAILTSRLKAQGVHRIVEPQTVRLAMKHKVLPQLLVADKIVMSSDMLDRFRVKVVGDRLDPVLYKVPEGYDDCLTSDEVANGLSPAIHQAVARRWMRDRNFPAAFRVRRNWLLPVRVVDGHAEAMLVMYGEQLPIQIGLPGHPAPEQFGQQLRRVIEANATRWKGKWRKNYDERKAAA